MNGIPVVSVMRRELIVPAELACVRIERQKTIGIKIVSLAAIAEVQRRWIARPPINQVQLGIITTGDPRWTSAVLCRILQPGISTGFVGKRNRLEAPRFLSCIGIKSVDKSTDAELCPGYADEDLILYD